MLKFTPLLLAVLYGIAMYQFSAWRTRKELDARSTELADARMRTIKADLDAFGGRQAVLADARGDTQKVRITNHLAEVIRQELSNPEGYQNAQLGFFQIVNSL